MNKRLRVDLHNHTTLCNHATGTVEEYVQRAIELGIDEYGFACHAPMNFSFLEAIDDIKALSTFLFLNF